MKYNKKRNSWALFLTKNVPFFIIFLILFPSFVFAEFSSDGNISYSVNPVSFDKDEKGVHHLEVTQPYSFDLKTIQRSMASMAYQTRLISWSKKKRVFSKDNIKYLAPLIVKQFTIANENQTLFFKVKDKKGKTLINGNTFFTKGGLHWRLTSLAKKEQQVGEYSVSGEAMKLVPRGSQVYKERKRYKGLKEHFSNWIIFPNIRPASSRRLASPSPMKRSTRSRATAPTSTKEIQKRLEILKELRKSGAIDEMEYRNKRDEILSDF